MALTSSIEWTDATWNPVTGCTKITSGCDNCYAARFAERWRGIPGHAFEKGFDLVLKPERLKQPLEWRRSKMIFVNSMSDLFHKDVPTEFIDRVFDTMEAADWHVFQILTKRSSLMRDYLKSRYSGRSPDHIWLGVSVEDAKAKGRIQHLSSSHRRALPLDRAAARGGRPMNLDGIHWVIAGEKVGRRRGRWRSSGSARFRDQCQAQNVPFFFKQWGGFRPKSGVAISMVANGASGRSKRTKASWLSERRDLRGACGSHDCRTPNSEIFLSRSERE